MPVRTMLVADASRRTTKHNAYVSGLGPTRRLVLFDTLLRGLAAVPELRGRGRARARAPALRPRRARDCARGARGGRRGARAVDRLRVGRSGRGGRCGRPGRPADRAARAARRSGCWRSVALPFETWLSRRWERVADRFALELTRDPEAMERMHRRLALANLADLDPPRPVYLLLFTHPTPPERIAGRASGRMARAREPLARAHLRAAPADDRARADPRADGRRGRLRRRRRLARAARRRRPHAHRRRRARRSRSAPSRSPAAPRAGAGRSASAASRSSPRT